ncbi:vegetative cell wall protein gp1-like [Gopherus evgoodei]|uniref:vegetative cell wall protein gp1-like n=1 Tax=Gopherus evgoodei TaxID=1825980 RepID=UPI0011CFDBAC|nr:vegetative cell wall protein gp1-like [Gopherus evgoodei]
MCSPPSASRALPPSERFPGTTPRAPPSRFPVTTPHVPPERLSLRAPPERLAPMCPREPASRFPGTTPHVHPERLPLRSPPPASRTLRAPRALAPREPPSRFLGTTPRKPPPELLPPHVPPERLPPTSRALPLPSSSPSCAPESPPCFPGTRCAPAPFRTHPRSPPKSPLLQLSSSSSPFPPLPPDIYPFPQPLSPLHFLSSKAWSGLCVPFLPPCLHEAFLFPSTFPLASSYPTHPLVGGDPAPSFPKSDYYSPSQRVALHSHRGQLFGAAAWYYLSVMCHAHLWCLLGSPAK